MTFTRNMPLPDDYIDESQGQFLVNDQVLSDSIATDHVAITAGSAVDFFKHKIIHSKAQPNADPQPTTLADEGAIYVKLDATGQDDLYYRHKSDGTVVKLTSGGSGGGNVLAWAYMTYQGAPNFNYLINYGSNIASSTSIITPSRIQINFTTPLASANYIVLLTVSTLGTGNIKFVEGSFTVNNFKVEGTANIVSLTVIG